MHALCTLLFFTCRSVGTATHWETKLDLHYHDRLSLKTDLRLVISWLTYSQNWLKTSNIMIDLLSKLASSSTIMIDLLSQHVDLLWGVFAHVIFLVVHAGDTPIHREQRPLESSGDGSVEILPLVLWHLKNDLPRIQHILFLPNEKKKWRGDGVAHLVECRTRDPNTGGSNPAKQKLHLI